MKMKNSHSHRYNYRFFIGASATVFIVSLAACVLYERNAMNSIPRLYDRSYDEITNVRIIPKPKVVMVKFPKLTTTSPMFSTYHVINRKEVYHINDKIQVLIRARDSKGNPQGTGGDYFRAKLVSEDVKAASRSDGEIVDFGNGTYLAEFILRWPGTAKVMVMLVDGSAAVHVLDRMRHEFPNRGSYIGHFKNGEILEDTECNVDHVASEEECNYTDNKTNIHWYCVRPANPGLQCKHWWKHTSNNTYIFEQQTKYIRPGEQKYFTAYKAYLDDNNCSISVRDEHNLTGRVDKYGRLPWREPWTALPMCLPGSITKFDNITSGYLYQEKWYSTRCRNQQFDAKRVAKCLTNKTVLILGDSTGKQVFTHLTKLLKLREIPPVDCMRHEREDSINFTIYQKFHGLPSRGSNGGPTRCLRQSIPYVLDHMAFIPDVFFLSVGAHYTIHTMDLLRQRLKEIRAAVERLHERSPRTLFIVKSANTRDFENLSHILSNNEWYLYTLDRLVREMFSSYRHVALIDAWDMTVAQFIPDNVHPGHGTLSNIVDLTLSYICPT